MIGVEPKVVVYFVEGGEVPERVEDLFFFLLLLKLVNSDDLDGFRSAGTSRALGTP
eukprot:CAMPEP_0170513152 /NCGR_PEP_ID=MMETSP0208-20121228/67243_1 /TAXON_ID=197538 /ORGANISM="Strombidium inclinatum, Strain S3" /LENGTH=55 /DNA_ID=CAMNT_0010796857 /DNA_START=1505 /DNA_END=1668 /DNA_ORIENTATION=+